MFNDVIPALSKGIVIVTISPIGIDLDCSISSFIFIDTKALGLLAEISSTLISMLISSPTIPNLGDDSIINLLSFSSLFPVSKTFIGDLKLKLSRRVGASEICPSVIIIAPANLSAGTSPIIEFKGSKIFEPLSPLIVFSLTSKLFIFSSSFLILL